MKANNGLEVVDFNLLICPACGGSALQVDEAQVVCSGCGKAYRKEPGKVFFTEEYFDVDNWEGKSSEFDLFKRESFVPKRPDKIGGPRIKDLRSMLKVTGVALNLGGGADSYEGFTNIDLGRYPNVHIVSSLQNIPYKDASVDLVVSNSVLEHIYDYKSVIEEIYRVLKPGGYLYLSVPNLCMRHHEYDYHRWTMPGLVELLGEFELVDHGFCRGVAYSIDTLMEALIVHKTQPGFFRESLRRIWSFVGRPFYWIDGDNSPEYAAMSQTIYAIVRKQEE